MLAQSVNHVTLDKARSPTKSERDSAVLEGLARGEGLSFFCNDCGDGEVRRSNPSGSRPNSFERQHLTFDKGGKCVGDFRGIVRFWKGWCGAVVQILSKKRKFCKTVENKGRRVYS